jgi:hypothetical protein
VLSKGSTDQAATAFVKYLASGAAATHWSDAKLEVALLAEIIISLRRGDVGLDIVAAF